MGEGGKGPGQGRKGAVRAPSSLFRFCRMSGEAGEELDTPAARVRVRRESLLRRARTRQGEG